jgi:hypothetical protein
VTFHPIELRAASRRLSIAAAFVALSGLAVGACSPAPSPSLPSASAPSSTATPTVRASTTSSAKVLVDPSLLEILPADVEGVPIVAEPDTATQLATDPSLAGEVEALAMALAVDSSSSREDLAIVSVVRLRPGLIGDEFFRSWRDTYDGAACAPAGGVAGNAEAEMGGRRVFIGSCTGGAFTYHVIHSGDVIVSITSVGDRRFGEGIVSNLGG